MRRLLRTLVLLVLLVALAGLGLGAAFLQHDPSVAKMPAPSPKDVRATRDFVAEVRKTADATTPEQSRVTVPLDTLRATLRLGARVLPGLRATARIEDQAVVMQASVPVPWIGGSRWLNLGGTIPAFDGAFALDTVEVGGHMVNPRIALGAARIAANVVLGNRAGDKIVTAASAMRITGDRVTFTLQIDDAAQGEVMQGLFSALRDDRMPTLAQIDTAYVRIREAMDAGVLPTQGSFLPYLTFTLRMALDGSSPETLPNAYTAAMFALTRVCVGRVLGPIIGKLAGDETPDHRIWQAECGDLTLAGRTDSRQHFVTAATLKAASNRGVAVSLGEFKELNDSLKGGSGFDFSDIAANNSGVRFSNLFMATPPEGWPALIGRIGAETDLIPDLASLPPRMRDTTFTELYGTIDSPAYAGELARIEALIDALPLHAP